ncbi:MAG: dihydrolipoyl dehydrogenase family protein [Candidatus Helarchaeota archaeon]
MKEYDLIIIGTGAGLNLVNTALSRGLEIALIEQGKVGGTCLTRGCIPSKILVYPADIIREAEHAKKVGVNFKLEGINWSLISKRMWNQINHSIEMEQGLKQVPGLTFYHGIGEFTGEYTMHVKLNNGEYSEEFRGNKIVIASGSRSFIPPIKGLEETGYITNESFFGEKFPKKPYKSLIIIGGGVIAAEFAHVFSSFGTKVTIVEMLPRLLTTEEPEISEFVEREFRKRMDVYTNYRAISASKSMKEKTVIIEHVKTGKQIEVKGEEILVATGRKSNADILKVDKTGVKTDKRGWIITNEYLETNKENVWCIGDANGKYQFRHKANYEAEILSHNLFASKDDRHIVDYSSVPWAIFTHPQVAHVGMTEQEALNAGYKLFVAIHHYSEVAKGYAMGYETGDDDDGFVKLVVSANRTILGVHIVGPHAAILLQPFVYLMNAGFTCNISQVHEIDKIPKAKRACPTAGSFIPIYRSQVIHPSLNEVTAWALGNLKPVNKTEIPHSHH